MFMIYWEYSYTHIYFIPRPKLSKNMHIVADADIYTPKTMRYL